MGKTDHQTTMTTTPTPQSDGFREILKQYWGYDDFRGIQYDIIRSIAQGHDTLGLMPTGGGKSITFQVPALACPGICIVITPLIALMRDQVDNLRRRGIKAAAVYSGMAHQDIIATLENCILGDYKFLYVSPERLGSEIFQIKLRHMDVSFITVDEAHCISQWGYDFRPSYLTIKDIRKIADVPVLALTATATPEVVDDIMHQLDFRNGQLFRMSFERPNLAYIIHRNVDKQKEMLALLREISGSAIIYMRNRKLCKDISEELVRQGVSATYYHAGLPNSEREERQKAWQNNEYRVMVATNAFGMGIDKSDVRLVIHMTLPDSLEAYFQEAGRAGRDGEQAYAIALYDKQDRANMMSRFHLAFPDKDVIRDIYEHLCYYYQLAMGDGYRMTREFSLIEFCSRFHYFHMQVHSALELLTLAGYIDYRSDEESNTRLRICVHREVLYDAIRYDDPLYMRLVNHILRTYTAIFVEQRYIDEDRLARDLDVEPRHIYMALKALAHRRLVEYIPRKHTTYITFTQRRVEKDRIKLSREVYDQRKAKHLEKLEHVIDYAEDEDTCRSKLLLDYFGEKKKGSCGRCDVCTADYDQNPTNAVKRKIAEEIIGTLNANGPSLSVTIKQIPVDNRQHLLVVLQELIDEEIIKITEYGRFYLARNHNPY